MEFCGVFYETGYLRAVYDRIRKLFFVFLMAAVLTVGMMGQGMETINFGSVRLKDMAGRAVAEYAAGVGTTGSFMISVTEIQISADVSADLFTVPAVISERSEDLNTGNSAAVVLPVEDAISDALMAEETISNILPGEETVPDAPIIETILPNDPPISGELSDIPVIDENISDDPALDEGGVGGKTVIRGGFVTDASGMICGFLICRLFRKTDISYFLQKDVGELRQEHSLPVKILFQKSIFLLIYQRLKNVRLQI